MMPQWMLYCLTAAALWGIVGLFQKMGTSRISADSLLIWMMVGYLITIPFLLPWANIGVFTGREVAIAILVGITNGLGAWFLFLSLGTGAKASVAVPLTALYPVVTIFLALMFLGERLTPMQWLGIGCAIAGGVMMSFEQPAEMPKKSEASASK